MRDRTGERRIDGSAELEALKAVGRAILGAEARAEGRKEGREEGRQEGRAKTLLAQLDAKFGRVPAAAKARILAAKEAQLERWSLRVLTAPTLEAVLDGRPKKTAPTRRRARAI